MTTNYNGIDIPDGPIGVYINNGIEAIEKNLAQSAGLQFKKAIETDKIALNTLSKLYKFFEKSKHIEACLVIGLNLLPFVKRASLANALGNYARKSGNSQQALELYKLALRYNRSFVMGAYNIAATLANSQFYDDKAIAAAKFIDGRINFITPEFYIENDEGVYMPQEDYLDHFRDNLLKQKRIEQQTNLIILKDSLANYKPFHKEFLEITVKIKKLEAADVEMTPSQIDYYVFQQLTEEETIKKDISKYNLTLIYLKNNKFNDAYKTLKLIDNKGDFKYLHMLIAICFGQRGHFENAHSMFIELLGQDPFDRYYNVNLGLLNRKQNRIVSSAKYLIKGFILLKESDNMYDKDQILLKANELYNNNDHVAASRYYQLLITEGIFPDQAPFHYAEILFKQNKIKDASKYLDMSIEKKGPYQKQAEELKEAIFQDLFTQGAQEQDQKKYKFAVNYFLSALDVKRPLSLIKRILTCMTNYKLNAVEIKLQKKLSEEADALLQELKDEKEAAEKEKLLSQQREYMNS